MKSPALKKIMIPFSLMIFSFFAIFVFYCIATLPSWLALYELSTQQPMPGQAGARYIGNVFDVDPEIGLVLRSDTEGGWRIAKGEPVPVRHGVEGFREPIRAEYAHDGARNPRLLFLGDSFTYGLLVTAEDSFPYKVGKDFAGDSINAGVPGYGLAQMVLQARRLIPKYHPDYVVVQYSPWLITRSVSEFYENSLGTVMAPYFYEEAGGGVGVAPIPFVPDVNLIEEAGKYKRLSEDGGHGKMSFIAKVAFPFFFKHHFRLAVFRGKQWLGLAPKAARNEAAVIGAAYGEINALAKANGARMVVLALGGRDVWHVREELLPAGVAGVHAWKNMVARLEPGTPDEYVRQYYLWRGNPPEPVDAHPNEHAHAVIAEVLSQRIRQLESERWQVPH